MKNKEIRELLFSKGIKHYELAEELGIAHTTLCNWLRYELSEERKAQILKAIDKLSGVG